MKILNFGLTFPVKISTIKEGVVLDDETYTIRTCEAQHSIPAFSYVFHEKEKPGIRLVFQDHGPGIANIALALTDGYTTGGGMGLGLFIAKTLLERSGAEINIRNRISGKSGANIHVEWPRSAMEASRPAALATDSLTKAASRAS